ncbi:ParA family protein [Parachitinimonas caeni]|uniref:ParA family protein n=1 Tax=Parachitinimonas caeni TaxID=3031301 RepID=A0ABT7DZI8_9NEIS|nr:ParA family protein [Parachitinimonas caeni]MDK2125482.1 ParA family protein [Parachitinimonas caeni]
MNNLIRRCKYQAMKTLAIYNPKGGVGKSTTTVNLADGFARRGLQVLVVDLDPQSNTSNTITGVSPRKLHLTGFSMIEDPNIPIVECIHETVFENVHILPMVMKLRKLEPELWRRDTDYLRIRLARVAEFYDICLIDCPPNLGKLTMMGLVAASHYLTPIKSADRYSLDGFDDLTETVAEVQREKNKELRYLGALLTMHDGRSNISKLIASDLESKVGDHILSNSIPQSVKINECIDAKKSIFALDANSSVGLAFARLVKEIMVKMGYIDHDDSDTGNSQPDEVNGE